MVDATAYWQPWEETVSSLADFQETLEGVFTKWVKESGKTFAWRGVVNATWPLHSSLYRRLAEKTGAGIGGTPWSEEPALAKAEAAILDEMHRWGLHRGATGPLSALEQLAVLQHFGAPTRLLDVTFDAYVALWFAVEERPEGNGQDGRVFVVDVTERLINEDGKLRAWENNHEVPWNVPKSTWLTDVVAWRPPPLDRRIAAQKGGFLLAGVPAGTFQPPKGTSGPAGKWQSDEARSFTCLPLRVHKLKPERGGVSADGQPVYTLRIAATAKEDIRRRLESLFGYSYKTLFPDVPGFADFTKRIVLT